MSLTFYYAPMSTATITECVLNELGVPHEKVRIDIRGDETMKPAFLQINPNGCVPAIVHDGTPIWESAAISMYLGEMFGEEKGLYPARGTQRGEAMKWITWGSVTLAEAGVRLAYSSEPGNDAANAKAKTDITRLLKILDGGLAGKSFLLGKYSLTDTHVFGLVGWLQMMKVDLKPFSNVDAWAKKCIERPAVAKAMQS